MGGGAVSDLVEQVVTVEGRRFSLLRPRDVDAIVADLVAAGVEDDDQLPLWAEVWPAGAVLAAAVAAAPLGRCRVLELGCGLGLVSVVAAAAGAEVLAVDRAPEATARTAANAARNGVLVRTAVCSFDQPGPALDEAPWDLVLASDVLYEPRNLGPLRALLPRLVSPGLEGGQVWLADPGRPTLPRFLAGLEEDGWRLEPLRAGRPSAGPRPDAAKVALWRVHR